MKFVEMKKKSNRFKILIFKIYLHVFIKEWYDKYEDLRPFIGDVRSIWTWWGYYEPTALKMNTKKTEGYLYEADIRVDTPICTKACVFKYTRPYLGSSGSPDIVVSKK